MATVSVEFDVAAVFGAGVPNGITITNVTTAEVATINSVTGTGTTDVRYDVTWIVDPVFGDTFTWDYDGLGDYTNVNTDPMEAQNIALVNCENPPLPIAINGWTGLPNCAAP